MQGWVRVVVLALGPCGLVAANDLPRHPTDFPRQPAVANAIAAFESLDRNQDLRLSRSEAGFDRVLSAIFADSDVDGDGYLTRIEYARATGGAPVNL